MENLRVGFGYDIHQIVENEGKLVIGGVIVSQNIRSVAHSDGDVLCHAIIDAILGAIGEGDIGKLFPETERTKGMSSIKALKKVVKIAKEKGYELINIDSTVVFSKLKLSDFRERIIHALSEVLNCPVSVKFKSGNGIGEVGQGMAIEAFATALLKRSHS